LMNNKCIHASPLIFRCVHNVWQGKLCRGHSPVPVTTAAHPCPTRGATNAGHMQLQVVHTVHYNQIMATGEAAAAAITKMAASFTLHIQPHLHTHSQNLHRPKCQSGYRLAPTRQITHAQHGQSNIAVSAAHQVYRVHASACMHVRMQCTHQNRSETRGAITREDHVTSTTANHVAIRPLAVRCTGPCTTMAP
jgi:hypothetical protein